MSRLRTFFVLVFLALPAFAATELVPGVHVLRGVFAPGAQPDGNTVILEGSGGLVVIDTGRHAAHTQAIVDFAKKAGRPVAAVINTHWHLAHIGGNVTIRRDYPAARVYATGALQEALTGFLANYGKQLQGMLADPKTPAEARTAFEAEVRLVEAGAKLAPDVVISDSAPRTIAGRALRLGVETHAVTAGDLWILDEKTGVLIAGDLVTLPAPLLDTACPARWGESLDRLAQVEFDLLVPGHGAPMTRRQFASYRTAYHELLACKGEKGPCIEGWLRAVGPVMSGFDDGFARALMDYYADVLRREPAAACGG